MADKFLSKPGWFFDNFVNPTYQEFLEQPLALHRAACAMVAVYHFWERLYEYYKENNSPHLPQKYRSISGRDKFKDFLISECPDLSLLNVSANAIKHSKTKVPEGNKFFDTGEDFLATGATKPSLEYHSTKATLLDQGELVIEDTGKSVSRVLLTVMTFWEKWLREHPDT